MSGRRIVVVTRRFWPLVGEAEDAIADLAVWLKSAGERPRILTPMWSRAWPRAFHFDGVEVNRIAHPGQRMWGDWRYARRLSRWLRRSRDEIDAAIVSGLGRDAATVIGALAGTNTPIVVVAEPRDLGSAGERSLSASALFRDGNAISIVVPDGPSRDALAAVGYPAVRLHVIGPGVALPLDTNGAARRDARRALSKACGDAGLNPLTPLAVFVGALEEEANLPVLIDAWKSVLGQRPDARLWLFGAGPQRRALHERIERQRMKDRVLLPGVMEHLDGLFAAADVYVAPPRAGPVSRHLLSAMAAGLPAVAADTPAHRAVIDGNEQGLLFSPGEPQEAASAILRLLAQPALAHALGESGRRRIAECFPPEVHVHRYIELLERLRAAKAR